VLAGENLSQKLDRSSSRLASRRLSAQAPTDRLSNRGQRAWDYRSARAGTSRVEVAQMLTGKDLAQIRLDRTG